MDAMPLLNVGRQLVLNRFVLTVATTGAGLVVWKFMKNRNYIDTKHGVIVITGCDTGLGYSLALHCHELGFCVFAGVLSLQTPGAKSLETNGTKTGRITVFTLDITDTCEIKNSVKVVSKFLENNSDYYLHAIVNNAGIMVFGEFEWQTDELIFQQINVNLLSAMNFTKLYLPLLRKYKGRIVNVSSHCALAGLPGLSVYAATKSGLQAWNDAIRVEYAKYGIKVISVMPGSFFNQSNILLKQSVHAEKMKSEMSDEAVEFYGDYFNLYQQYLSGFSTDMALHRLQDIRLYRIFTNVFVSKDPCSSYINSPFRYSLYHFLFRFSPTFIRDHLVENFVSMPSYKK